MSANANYRRQDGGRRASRAHGVPQDYAEARRWYGKAAGQGYEAAQFRLGVMLEKGQGGPQDYAQARFWYGRAAAHRFAEAQYNLGVLCEHGKGGPQDKRAAKEWFRKACDGGDQDGCGKYRELNEAGF